MDRFTVIGLGNFGAYIAARLFELGHEVIAIDSDGERVDRIGPHVTRAAAGDGTNRAVLDDLGVRESRAAVISTGDDLAASVLALLALRDLGVEDVYVKVSSDDHRRIVEALGAAESIFPERQSAENLATRLTSRRLLKYMELGDQFCVQEMAVPDAWAGKTLRELALPTRHRIQIVAIHDILRDEIDVPQADRKLTPSDALFVAGRPDALDELTRI